MRAYMYVFNTLSDWEWGFISAELNTGRFFKNSGVKVPVTTIANTLDPIRTMGDISIVPYKRLDEISFADDDILILPGGETWLTSEHEPVLVAAEKLLARRVLVAAICGATEAFANRGILDSRKHTSTSLSHLEHICPNYRGRDHF
ncbi:MAG TPA: DJ-1/PfpI family protein, partial [Spirochaetota bacterium]